MIFYAHFCRGSEDLRIFVLLSNRNPWSYEEGEEVELLINLSIRYLPPNLCAASIPNFREQISSYLPPILEPLSRVINDSGENVSSISLSVNFKSSFAMEQHALPLWTSRKRFRMLLRSTITPRCLDHSAKGSDCLFIVCC